VLALLVRRRRGSFPWTLAGLFGSLLGFGSWLALVQPVNRPIAKTLARGGDVPGLWVVLRDRWEYGHATGFVLQLLGFAALLASVLVETGNGDGAPR
jgi:hypothetical protein